MQPLYETESRLWFSLGSVEQPPMQEQRLSDKEHHREQQPHDDHGMHPPIAGGQKAVPQIETDQHVQRGIPPIPVDAKTSLPGCALASAMNSASVFAGTFLLTTMISLLTTLFPAPKRFE